MKLGGLFCRITSTVSNPQIISETWEPIFAESFPKKTTNPGLWLTRNVRLRKALPPTVILKERNRILNDSKHALAKRKLPL